MTLLSLPDNYWFGQSEMSENREQLRKTFDQSAEVYDHIRPSYPDALIDNVIYLSGIPEQGRILEIGCATGKATEPFAFRGYSMDCLDIGIDLAELAARKFGGLDNVRIIVHSFEEWESPNNAYDLVIAATSFHWVDPAVAYVKSAEVLNATGALAVFSNAHIQKDQGFFADVQEVYRLHVPEWFQPVGNSKPSDPVAAPQPGIDRFHEPTRRVYPWKTSYTAEEYITLLSTYSDHIALPDGKRQALFDDIEELIKEQYNGKVLKYYEATLDVRRKCK